MRRPPLTYGYTAVEVLMAITIMAIGAAGVISMQRTSIQGNVDARKMDMASAIAREWIDRIRRDATTWTQPSSSNPLGCPGGPGCLDKTTFINFVNTSPGTWVFPTLPTSQGTACGVGGCATGWSPAFDIFGRDLSTNEVNAATNAPTAYCVNLRFKFLDKNPQSNLIEADVRVFWLRNLGALPGGASTTYSAVTGVWCNSASTTAADPTTTNATTLFHYLYATTTVRQNPAYPP